MITTKNISLDAMKPRGAWFDNLFPASRFCYSLSSCCCATNKCSHRTNFKFKT